ncbi:MAG: histidine phosphatase family protein [Bdellovibrionales bacterium]
MSFFERPPVTLYLMRHGQSEANVDKNVYRQKPDHAIALTPLGLAQASEAGAFLAKHFDEKTSEAPCIILRSPYERARQTEERVANAIQSHYSERVELPELAEQQYGLFDGVPPDELEKTFPQEYNRYLLAQQQMGKFWARPPQGEALFDVYNRARAAVHYIRYGYNKAKINTYVIVAHANWIRCFLMAWCNYPYEWIAEARVPESCEIMKVVGHEIIGNVFAPIKPTHEAVHEPAGRVQ